MGVLVCKLLCLRASSRRFLQRLFVRDNDSATKRQIFSIVRSRT